MVKVVKVVSSIPGFYTRWDEKLSRDLMKDTSSHYVVSPGHYVVTGRSSKFGMTKLSVLLDSGFPSKKHHYWVKTSILKRKSEEVK